MACTHQRLDQLVVVRQSYSGGLSARIERGPIHAVLNVSQPGDVEVEAHKVDVGSSGRVVEKGGYPPGRLRKLGNDWTANADRLAIDSRLVVHGRACCRKHRDIGIELSGGICRAERSRQLRLIPYLIILEHAAEVAVYMGYNGGGHLPPLPHIGWRCAGSRPKRTRGVVDDGDWMEPRRLHDPQGRIDSGKVGCRRSVYRRKSNPETRLIHSGGGDQVYGCLVSNGRARTAYPE